MIPFVRSVSARKRKEKIFSFPSNVSKLNIKAKRNITIPFPYESIEEVIKCVENDISPGDDLNVDSLGEATGLLGLLKASEATNGVDGFGLEVLDMGGSEEDTDVVKTTSFRSAHDSCELAKKRRSQHGPTVLEAGLYLPPEGLQGDSIVSTGFLSHGLDEVEAGLGSLRYEHKEQMHDDVAPSAKAFFDPIQGRTRESNVFESESAHDAPVGVNSSFTHSGDCGTHALPVCPFGHISFLNAEHIDLSAATRQLLTAPISLPRNFHACHMPVDPTDMSKSYDVVLDDSLDQTSPYEVTTVFNDGPGDEATRPSLNLPSKLLAGHDLVDPTGTSNPPKAVVLAASQDKSAPHKVTSTFNANCLGQLNGHFENDLSLVQSSIPDKDVHYHMGVTQGQEHNVTGGAQCKSWAGLFKSEGQSGSKPQFVQESVLDLNYKTTENSKDFKLEFVDHGGTEDDLVLKIPKDLTADGKDEWTTTLVGRFLGKKLPFSLVSNVTERLWANEGLIDTLATDSGCFFFSFSSTEARDAILEGGPWFVVGQPLLLRPWKPHFSFENEEVRSVPIWVNFYGLPLEYWNPKGISFISSFIGKPIRVDRITASRRRITYARVCIEVSADFDFFNEFHIESEDEETGNPIRTKINLEYQWTPVRCKKCAQFGHDCSRSASLGLSHQDRHPLKRNGKEKGTWQVVSGKDKGKKTVVDNTSDRTKSMNGLVTPLAKDNRFEALSQLLEEPDPKPVKVDTIVSPSARTSCPEASSSYQADVPRGETREETTFPFCVDDDDDCISDSGLASEDGTPLRGSHLSNRQKKKAAKMKFSGSRPKGRQRS